MFNHPFFQDKKNAWVVVVLGILAGLLTIWLALKALRPIARSACGYIMDSDDDKRLGREGRQVSVEASTVNLGTMSKRINTVGKLNANAIVTIKSEINGRIKEILFTEGREVSKGDPIIQFEDQDAQAELKQAEAEFARTEADFERLSKLHEQKIGSSKDYDKARADYKMSEAKVEAAKARLAKTVIQAPFDGTVGLINFSAGAFVQVNQELVTIVDSSPMRVEFKVPEKFANDVGVGQQAEVKIDAFKDQTFMAMVDAVDAKVESESHSIAIKASIPNENGLLKAGLFANISLIIGEKGDTLMVDEAAVDRDGEIEFVWTVEKGKAGRRRVLTGVRENGKIEIIAGIRPGQIVVTSGQIKLADGVRVKIVNPQEEAQGENNAPGEGETPKIEAPKTESAVAPKTETLSESNESLDAKPQDDQKPEDNSSPQNQEKAQ
jgi:membrane fusion protein (multidrug efflux system)